MISSLTTNVSRRCRVLPSMIVGQPVQAFALTRLASRSLFTLQQQVVSSTPLLHIQNNHNGLVSSRHTRRFYAAASTPSTPDNSDTTTTSSTSSTSNSPSIFSTPSTFQSIGIQSPVLLDRLQALGFHQPTRIQEETVPQWHSTNAADPQDANNNNNNNNLSSSHPTSNTLILGSETGSGKTLAYLLPLLDQLLLDKQKPPVVELEPLAKAIILVPNKELIQQVLRMAIPLCGTRVEDVVAWGGGVPMPTTTNMTKIGGGRKDTTIRLAVLPGGLMEPNDFPPFQNVDDPTVDILITTPASLGPWGLKPKHVSFFADVETLVIDEADMLLDGGYRKPLEQVLVGFQRADKLHLDSKPPTRRVFCAATLPDMGLKSVDSFLKHKFPRAQRLCMSGMHQARHFGLKQPTQWVGPLETKKERMDDLIELLRTPIVNGGLQGEKVMIFLNSVGDVQGASGALARAGFDAVEYHAKLKLDERSHNLDRFRAYNSPAVPDELVQVELSGSRDTTSPVPILICTDLASRGLDIPGVTAVVQLQFSGNVVSHLHRMGRCGRAGQRIGRGIVYYGSTEAELVEMVRDAEDQQERMVLPGDVEDVDVEGESGGDGNGEGIRSKGNIDKAFSRKRGLSRKRKKRLREGDQA